MKSFESSRSIVSPKPRRLRRVTVYAQQHLPGCPSSSRCPASHSERSRITNTTVRDPVERVITRHVARYSSIGLSSTTYTAQQVAAAHPLRSSSSSIQRSNHCASSASTGVHRTRRTTSRLTANVGRVSHLQSTALLATPHRRQTQRGTFHCSGRVSSCSEVCTILQVGCLGGLWCSEIK